MVLTLTADIYRTEAGELEYAQLSISDESVYRDRFPRMDDVEWVSLVIQTLLDSLADHIGHDFLIVTNYHTLDESE